MSFADFLFWTVALLTAACAVMTAATQNIVRAACWLLFTLAGTGGLYFLLGADFLGAVHLIVYVGGILILVVFGIMLTAQGPFVYLRTPGGEWAMSLLVGLLIFAGLTVAIVLTDWKPQPTTVVDHPGQARNDNDLGLALLGFTEVTPRVDLPALPGRERTPMSYLLPFEIVSVHLLVVLIGAAYLARAKRRADRRAAV